MSHAQDKLQWFRDARFGLFIHWGAYSLLERGEQVLFREHLIPSEYRKRARAFNPTKFDADEWASVAKKAGMKYAVLTTKHHDGFCMFDTATTDYSSVKTAAGRDFVAEYVRAFRRAGIRVGLYFSLTDWNCPAYFAGPRNDPKGFRAFRKMVHEQVRELCSNYGKLDVLWFDGDWPHSVAEWQSGRMEKMIRTLQPNILINNRLFKSKPGTGDFGTPEQHIPGAPEDGAGRPWEACITSTHRWWGWHSGDRFWKSPEEIILSLCNVANGGGNLLLNVGPKPDGSFPVPFVRSVTKVGQWLKRNGEAIYGTRPGVSEVISVGFMTVKKKTAYLLITFWPGEKLHLCGLRSDVVSARILGERKQLRVERKGEHIYIRGLPRKAPDPICTVIKLALDSEAKPYPWVAHQPWGNDGNPFVSWAEE